MARPSNGRPQTQEPAEGGATGVAAAHALPQGHPWFRGVIPVIAALLAPALVGVLALSSRSGRATAGIVVFGASLCLTYAVSALYHRSSPNGALHRMLRPLDHSAIFLFIAGTYTPLCLAMPQRAAAATLLISVWAVAIVGVCLTLFRPTCPRTVFLGLYLVAGWLALPLLWQVADWLAPESLGLLLLGGVLYTAGAAVYSTRWPDPFPSVWGFHETFHLLVLGGTVSHVTVVAAVTVRA